MGGTPVPTARPALPSHDGQDVKRTCLTVLGFHHSQGHSFPLTATLCPCITPRRSAKGTAGVQGSSFRRAGLLEHYPPGRVSVGSPRPSPSTPAFRQPLSPLGARALLPGLVSSSGHRPASAPGHVR